MPYRPLQGIWAWTHRQKRRRVHADVPLRRVEAMSAWTLIFGLGPGARRNSHDVRARTKKGARPEINVSRSGARRTAAAYSPTWWGSTIGDAGLNFSVRNGKRWIPGSIATAVCDLREKTPTKNTRSKERSRAISTGRLKTLLPLHLLPIDVVVSHDPQGKSHLGDGFALRCFQRLS